MDFSAKKYTEYLTDVEHLARQYSLDGLNIAVHCNLVQIFQKTANFLRSISSSGFIVELGVSKEALVNKCLWRAADLTSSFLLSIDINDCSEVCNYSHWHFRQDDDINFSRKFVGFCLDCIIPPSIDILFIDTDEHYHHSLDEIKNWFPKLSKKALVFFRCTNLKKRLYYEDGRSTGLGWDNKRGVIRALEDYFERFFDETKVFEAVEKGWKIHHTPWGGGLTILER